MDNTEAKVEVIKQDKLFRRFETPVFEIRKEGDAQKLSFPASSERPVERWYGDEVLVHDKKSIRLERATSGAMPLLFNHDMDDPIGMITGASVSDGRLLVDAELFSTDRASEIQKMIDGGLRNVSIAYRVNKVEEEVKTQTYRVTDWEPFEVSIVTVPADPSVGIGRGVESSYEMRIIREASHQPAEKAATKERAMPEKEEGVTAVADDKPRKSPIEYERERRQAIINLCQSFNADARSEAQWIEDGTPLTEVSEKLLEIARERGKKKTLVNSTIGLTGNETRKYSLFKAIRALRFGAVDRSAVEAAAFELDCSKALARQLGRTETGRILIPAEVLQRPVSPEAYSRAMATQPGSKGGYLVNTENMGFIEILRNRSVAMAMGARVLSGLVGNVSFARQTGKASVTWQAGEGVSVTASDQALGQLSMSPKTAIAITDVSEQLLAQSSPSAESFIMADLARDVAIDGVDAAVINGTGGAQPLGIKNTTGVTTGQDASSATYAKILAFPTVAAGVNALRGNPGFVTNTAGAAKLMGVQRFSNTDTPLWEGNLLNGQLVGFNAMSSEQAASGNLIFGSWDEVLIGEWGVLELATDNGGTRFNAAQVGIRAMWLVDVLIRYPQAFVVSTGLS